MKIIKKTSNAIYECKGVYGDEEKFTTKSLRLNQMMDYVRSLETSPKRVLDIGCGTGFFSKKISEIYPMANIYGIDISQRALSIAKQKYQNIKFIKSDAELQLPFKNNFFDLIISGEHIEHTKDVDTYLLEIYRVMTRNGILILTTPNLGSWLNRMLLLFGLQPFYLEPSLRKTLPILSYFGKTFPEDLSASPSGHLRLYTLNMLKKLLEYYGFALVEVKGRAILKGYVLKQIDLFFSKIPSLSYGLVLKLKKKSKKTHN